MSAVGMDMETMTMYFYQSCKVKFLFANYSVDTDTGYFGACMVSFFFGFVCETLAIILDRLDQQTFSKLKQEQRMLRGKRCSQGFVYMLQMLFAYFCMLAVMTYNLGILFCVVGGLAFAYFLLGFSPAEMIVV